MKLNAANRLTSQPLTDSISDKNGLYHCKMYYWNHLSNSKGLGTKGGISLSYCVANDEPTFLLSTSGSVIGYLTLAKSTYGIPGVKFSINSAFLNPQYRGRKLGTVMYLGALHVLKHMASDAVLSKNAIHSWRSLLKYGYKVKLWNNTTGKPQPFVWGDEMPVVGGLPISAIIREEFVLYI